jgi:hypothetical protein
MCPICVAGTFALQTATAFAFAGPGIFACRNLLATTVALEAPQRFALRIRA